MKAIYNGYISVDQNAGFVIEQMYRGKVIGEIFKEFPETVSGLDVDTFDLVIGEEYEIEISGKYVTSWQEV